MKKLFLCFVSVILLSFNNAPSVVGKWKTIDDESGKAVSIVEIYEKGGKVYGKIFDVLNPADKHRKCVNCTGDDKNKALLGLTVIKGLTKDGKEFTNGKILDPKSGKLYKCFITLESPDKLKVRGYIGVSVIGRTQIWHRVH